MQWQNDSSMAKEDELSNRIIGAAIEVHRELGAGLLESAYEISLARELELRGIPFERQVPQPVIYKDVKLECGYRMDIVVNDAVVIEIKSVNAIEDIHEAQCLTYLRFSGKRLCLLLNFNTPLMKDGIKRIILGAAARPAKRHNLLSWFFLAYLCVSLAYLCVTNF